MSTETRVDEVSNLKRRTDHSTGAQLSRFIVRYSPILVLIYTIVYTYLISTGFGWNTPKEKMDTLAVQVNTLADDVREQRSVQERTLDVLEILSVQPCLDLRKRADPYVFRRLKCETILEGVN